LLWNWKLNLDQYPNWNSMIDSWALDGVKPMLYINPYFANMTGNPEVKTNYFKQGDD